MSKDVRQKDTIGKAEYVSLPEYDYEDVPARIDTGAKTSSIWATSIVESSDGLRFQLFNSSSPHYKDITIHVEDYEKTIVSSTIGEAQERYKVKMYLVLGGRRILSSFTLADRSKQVYPILIGRNVLNKKFVVDVEVGQPLRAEESARTQELQRKFER